MKAINLSIYLLLAVSWWAGCAKPASQSQTFQAGAAEAAGERKPATVKTPASQLYVEVSALGSLDYFYDHKLGMKLAGEAFGVKTEYVGPPDYDMAAMIAAFEQVIVKRPNGIVVVGFESSLSPIVDKAVDAGIPVVTVDADLVGSKRVAFVGTGNFEAGVTGGAKLAGLVGGKGKVALLTKPGQPNLEERIAGYKSALAKYPEIELVQIADTQSDPIIAAQAAATLLQKFPDLAGIGCVEAAGGAGSATAVREAGKEGVVRIVAMDRGNDVLEHIKNGVISATVVQNTALMPFYAVQILRNLNNHPVPIATDNAKAGITGAPAAIDTGVFIVDAANCEYFMRSTW